MEIARVKEENHRLKAKLDRYASDVRQKVQPNPNKVFSGLFKIRDA